MNILVSGSSGFIARYLIPALVAEGHSVIGIDKRPGPSYGGRFRFVHGNILDDRAVENAMDDVDLIIHLAAEHKDFGVPEALYYEVNVEGTRKLLQHANRHAVRRFFFYSSVAVYGDSAVPTHETLKPAPVSPYGTSKFLAEQRVEAWSTQSADLEAVILRPTVIFGPHNYANMYRLIESVAKRRYIGVGSGENIKSIGFVRNIAAATQFLLERTEPGVQVFNFADAPHMTTRDLVACISRHLQMRVPAIRVPKALALVFTFPLDLLSKVTKLDFPLTAKRIHKFSSSTHHSAEKLLRAGFAPQYTLDAGICETVAWYSTARQPPLAEESRSDVA